MNGLFLQGGGAKGAFQAGAIYALREAGLTFSIVSGTSIGSINGYFLYLGQEEAMKQLYTQNDLLNSEKDLLLTDVVTNDSMISILSDLPYIGSAVESFFVNYVHVENRQVTEIQKDIAKETKQAQLHAVKASSLLPFSLPEGRTSVTSTEVSEKYGDRIMGPYFEADVLAGKYEKYDLDGGILNNFFMEPFAKNKVDKLYLLSLDDALPIPKYLTDIYDKDDIIVIEREKPFSPYDTMNFSQPFMKHTFMEGYEAAKKVL